MSGGAAEGEDLGGKGTGGLLAWPYLPAAVVVGLELLASAADLLLGPYGRLHWEELFNARAGVQLTCGHWESAWELQYRTFCGGCTGEAALAVPVFGAVGPTLLAWKALPVGFHMVMVAGGAWLSGRTAGPRAALIWGLLMLAAPGFHRELSLLGWGNHAESAAFPMLALMAVALGAEGGRLRGLLGMALAGLFTGLGLWFCHTMAYAAPAIGLVALMAGRWRCLALPLGLPLGLLPWWLYHRSRPPAMDFAGDWLSAIQPAPPAALLDWLWGGDLREGLWPPLDYADWPGLAGLWWGLYWLCGLGGLWLLLRLLREPEVDRLRRGLALYAPVGMLALLLAYALRYDLWSNLPDPYATPTFNLRYRAPLVPLLGLGAAVLLGAGGGERWTRLRTALLALLLGFGLVQRLGQWTEWRGSYVGLRVYSHEGWPDKTVPVGLPAQPLRRAQGRSQDIAAALAFLEGHEDPLPECRQDHRFELGRRLGLGLLLGSTTAAELERAAEGADPIEARFLAEGLVMGLWQENGQPHPDIARGLERLRGLAPGLWAPAVQAVGRRDHRDRRAAVAMGEELRQGWCEGWGRTWVEWSTDNGAQAPRALEPGEFADSEAQQCRGSADFARGQGEAWARMVGCAEEKWEALEGLLQGPAEAGREGWGRGCSLYRGE